MLRRHDSTRCARVLGDPDRRVGGRPRIRVAGTHDAARNHGGPPRVDGRRRADADLDESSRGAYDLVCPFYLFVGASVWLLLGVALLAVSLGAIVSLALLPVGLVGIALASLPFGICVQGMRDVAERPTLSLWTWGSGSLGFAVWIGLLNAPAGLLAAASNPVAVLCSVHWSLFLLCRALHAEPRMLQPRRPVPARVEDAAP